MFHWCLTKFEFEDISLYLRVLLYIYLHLHFTDGLQLYHKQFVGQVIEKPYANHTNFYDIDRWLEY